MHPPSDSQERPSGHETSSTPSAATDSNLPGVQVQGGQAFAYIKADLSPGDTLVTEAGAMASMGSGIDLRSGLNGNLLSALLIKFFGSETLFINRFRNVSKDVQSIVLTNPTPGEIICAELNNEHLYLQAGAFIASTEGIRFRLRFAGFSSWMAGEGLFRLLVSGTGKVWYGAFGAIVPRQVHGSYIVDSGHLLSYPTGMKLKIQLSGGLFSSFFGGEGFVLRLEGQGTIQLQTRSLGGLAGWLNPKFWG